MPRYTLCPFYQWEYKRRITCEDTYRHFDSLDEKEVWMDVYCDSEWKECPYAQDLHNAYDSLEKGDVKALEKQKIQAMQKEMKSLATKLGRAQKKNEELEKRNRDLFKKWREAEEQTDAAKMEKLTRSVIDQTDKVLKLYKNVACYLLKEHGGKVYEEDVESWADGKVYTIYREYDDKGKLIWQVVAEEAKEIEKDGEDTQADEQKPTSESENGV